MEPPRKPSLLRISPQMTPSQDDPPDADKFYWALGVANVAWGRLEGQFLTCLMLIIQLANDKHIATKLPMKFKPQADLWKDAFERIPSLKPFKRMAAAFFVEFDDLSNDRDLMAHALWETFMPHSPLTIKVLKIKAVKGAKVETHRTSISINELGQFTAKANSLILHLTKILDALSQLHGAPP
jgi:hypothetical protein